MRPKIVEGLQPTERQLSCIKVIFYEQSKNPLFPISATDDRGVFYGLDYATILPHLVEIIHSKPHIVRGNHVHANCTEVFSVLSGTIDMYFLCQCDKKHLFSKRFEAGMSAVISPGVAHAIYTLGSNESVAVFGDGDPREDRKRVDLITL